jgi:hypothetical protein
MNLESGFYKKEKRNLKGNAHTHTHTHTDTQREREREGKEISKI